MGSSGAEAKARSVLVGLGFSEEGLDQPMGQISGGWKTRCSLACALCQSADLLLLDEPTNFLDLPSIIWLENFINSLAPSVTVLVVSHDRAFADAVANELLVMRNLQLERFKGPYFCIAHRQDIMMPMTGCQEMDGQFANAGQGTSPLTNSSESRAGSILPE